MTKPVSITSNRNGIAVGAYLAEVVMAPFLISTFVTIKALQGVFLLPVMGVMLLAGGGLALYSIFWVSRSDLQMIWALTLEHLAGWTLVVANVILAGALFVYYGPSEAVPTKILVLLPFVFGLAYRGAQIRRDRRNLRESMEVITPADPQLAEKDPDR